MMKKKRLKVAILAAIFALFFGATSLPVAGQDLVRHDPKSVFTPNVDSPTAALNDPKVNLQDRIDQGGYSRVYVTKGGEKTGCIEWFNSIEKKLMPRERWDCDGHALAAGKTIHVQPNGVDAIADGCANYFNFAAPLPPEPKPQPARPAHWRFEKEYVAFSATDPSRPVPLPVPEFSLSVTGSDGYNRTQVVRQVAGQPHIATTTFVLPKSGCYTFSEPKSEISRYGDAIPPEKTRCFAEGETKKTFVKNVQVVPAASTAPVLTSTAGVCKYVDGTFATGFRPVYVGTPTAVTAELLFNGQSLSNVVSDLATEEAQRQELLTQLWHPDSALPGGVYTFRYHIDNSTCEAQFIKLGAAIATVVASASPAQNEVYLSWCEQDHRWLSTATIGQVRCHPKRTALIGAGAAAAGIGAVALAGGAAGLHGCLAFGWFAVP